MRPALLLALGLTLASPTAASAAPFGELPFKAVSGAATCLRATGTPGELVRSTATGVQFLQAGASGLTTVADLPAETGSHSCPQAATRPGGAGIVAFNASDPNNGDAVVQARLRDPGGAWGPATEVLRSKSGASTATFTAAVSERGDALVTSIRRPSRSTFSIVVARRAPGTAFAATETLQTAGTTEAETRVRAGISSTGEAVVAWAFQPRGGAPRELWAAVAAPGAPFGAPVKIGLPRAGSPFALTVGSAGHALLAFGSGDDLLVAERAPGADFGAAARVGGAKDIFAVFPVAAVRADGGAVVAWHGTTAPTQAVVRQAPGPFSPPVTVAPRIALTIPRDRLRLVLLLFPFDEGGEFTTGGAGPDGDGGGPRAAITPDGRALITWSAPVERDGVWWNAPRSATLSLTGGTAELRTHGAELRDVSSLTPLELADGRAAVVWSDNDKKDSDGRLHLALEGGADGADPVPPSIRVGSPASKVVGVTESLVLPVHCSAACDIRAAIAGDDSATGTASLRRAGDTSISIDPSNFPIAPARGGPVKIVVRYGAPGTRRAAAKSLTIRLKRPAVAARPKLLDAVARRDGDDVVVTWRTDRGAKAENFLVYGTATNARDAAALVGGAPSGKQRQFRVRLRKAKAARFVTILSFADGYWGFKETKLRVRR